jgi:hypothetical protein
MYSNRPEVKTFQITPFKITNILNVQRRQHYETMGNMPEASNVGIPGILILKAVFHVPPAYKTLQTCVPLFKTFGLH